MSVEAKAGSALPVARLGLGLGKGYAYTAGTAAVGTIVGTALTIAAGTLLLMWVVRSVNKKGEPKT